MRIIHTADIHLDRTCATLGLPHAHGSEIRAHLQTLFQHILKQAAECDAAAVVVTGDLFEHGRVTRATVNFLRETFAAAAPVTILICPGKHDPCISGSPWLTEEWPANVRIFTPGTWQSVELPDGPVTVHGTAWDTAAEHSTGPETLEIPDDGRIHLAFTCGLEDTLVQDTPDGPTRFEPGRVLPAGLAFLGLGARHTTLHVAGTGNTPVWYAGAPEGGHFDDRGPHHYLELEVEKGEPVAVTPRTASNGLFHHITLDCSPFNTGQDLIDAVRGELQANDAAQYVRLTLTGTLIRPIYAELEGIRDALVEDVQYLQWHDNSQLGEDYDAVAREHTSLGAFVAKITREIDDAPAHDLAFQRGRSRDLGICAFRGTTLPIRGLTGDYR